LEFPIRNSVYAALLALGVATTLNVDVYRADFASIQNQVAVSEVEHAEHLPHVLPTKINVQLPQQAQATPRPSAPGEDFSTAQLLPQYRSAADLARFEDDEAAAVLASGLIIVVTHGLDAATRKRREREREEREREEREREKQEREKHEREKHEREAHEWNEREWLERERERRDDEGNQE